MGIQPSAYSKKDEISGADPQYGTIVRQWAEMKLFFKPTVDPGQYHSSLWYERHW